MEDPGHLIYRPQRNGKKDYLTRTPKGDIWRMEIFEGELEMDIGILKGVGMQARICLGEEEEEEEGGERKGEGTKWNGTNLYNNERPERKTWTISGCSGSVHFIPVQYENEKDKICI